MVSTKSLSSQVSHNPAHIVLVGILLGTSWPSGLDVHSGGTRTYMQGIVEVGIVLRTFHRGIVVVAASLPVIVGMFFFVWF